MPVEIQENKCQFCEKCFKQEKTLHVHTCEPGRRHKQKNLAHVRLGLNAFQTFFKIAQGAVKDKTYEEFCKSQYYLSFVKFGRYMIDVGCINPKSYIDWVITKNFPLNQWNNDKLYTSYLQDWVLREDHYDAAQRSLNTMADWADENNSIFNHYFLYASTPKIIYDINRGQISAWVIFNSVSGREWLEKLSSDELVMIWPMVNADKWSKMISLSVQAQKDITKLLEEAGL